MRAPAAKRLAIRFFKTDALPHEANSYELVGEKFGAGACVIFFEGPPGQGPRLHRHPYVEILIVLAGTSTFDDGETKREVPTGEMAVVDAGQAHGFVNNGPGVLRQIDIHLSPRFITEWLA